jgi:phosphate transport system permease protein
LKSQMAAGEAQYQEEMNRLETLSAHLNDSSVLITDANGQEKRLPVSQIIRAFRPNEMGVVSKSLMYMANVWRVLSEEPREANTEGGIFPAIFGTVMMVLIMTIAVVPFGVLAALYLREYARQGVLVRLVRIAVNNLAGVPSIVFGVFGLGFFVYAIGGTIDSVFFAETLPTPTYGTGGILWASLTLALLTVPVVIVATEEGLAAVPRDLREGSLALGATKLETLARVVVPSALPGILTGLILAMARAAGEVAPLMLTGVVKLAPTLPFDWQWPFFHLDRKFMHLGFHIYDVGFQSPNVEAAKPMVYITTLVLIMVVVLLNLMAITLRNRLRKKYAGSAV